MRKIVLFIMALILIGCTDKPATEKILLDFETDQDLDRVYWKCHTLFSLSEEHATHGSSALRMELYPSVYPGLAPVLTERDWRPYKWLCFDIYNPNAKELQITVRIDDKKENEYADRYNKAFRLGPGINRVEIPIASLVTSGTKRKLDLKNINRFLIFMASPTDKNVLYLDYIRLAG
jgi:hypothetical protein